MNAEVNRCDKVESLEFKHDLDMVGTVMDYDFIMTLSKLKKKKLNLLLFENNTNIHF